MVEENKCLKFVPNVELLRLSGKINGFKVLNRKNYICNKYKKNSKLLHEMKYLTHLVDNYGAGLLQLFDKLLKVGRCDLHINPMTSWCAADASA